MVLNPWTNSMVSLSSLFPSVSFLIVEVSAYHVGGGWNDAALAKDIKSASVGFLNGTFQEFDLGNVFPWGLVIQWSEFYTQWYVSYIQTHLRQARLMLASKAAGANQCWHWRQQSGR